MTRSVSRHALAFSIALASGCGAEATHADEPAPARRPAPVAEAPTAPTSLEPVITREALAQGSYQLYRWRFPLAQTQLRIVDTQMQQNVTDVLRQGDALLVVNGGFFGTDGSAEGLATSEGHTLSEWLPRIGGGVLTINNGSGELHDGEVEPPIETPDFAIQCLPRIVVEGELNIRRDDGRLADRTALCLRDQGQILDIYIARTNRAHGGPTLYAFGQILVARGCENALNLDGGPSTSAAWRTPGGTQGLRARGPIRHAVALHAITDN